MNSPVPPVARLIDTHAHLDDRRLRMDLAGVLGRAREAGVSQIIAVGTTAASSAGVIELSQSYPGVFAAVGIHPNDAAEVGQEDWPKIVDAVAQPGVVAIGETGLDRYWKYTPFEIQQIWFERHLRLAYDNDLPVIIHCRDCQHEIIDQLRALSRSVRGVMHAFTGTWDQARACLDLGLHLSFAGMVTFTNKSLNVLREVAARVPLDRLLIETDAPYLSPHPFRGQTNEPARVTWTALALAGLRGLSLGELGDKSTANATQLFRLPSGTSL